jgi:hypothetical protein
VEIDLDRWRALLQQVRDIRYELRGANQQLAEAQERSLAANATRDHAASERALNGSHRREIAAVAAANLADAEAAAAGAVAELARVQARVSTISARFGAQSAIVEACQKWAAQKGTILPDTSDLSARGLVPETRGGDTSFAAGVEAAAALDPAPGSAPAARADHLAGQPPGWVGRLRSAIAWSPA